MNAINNTPAIGGVKLRNCVALAPMAGICDQTYRRLATAQGVGFVCTEMISAKGLLYHNEKTLRMLALSIRSRSSSSDTFRRNWRKRRKSSRKRARISLTSTWDAPSPKSSKMATVRRSYVTCRKRPPASPRWRTRWTCRSRRKFVSAGTMLPATP